MRLELYRQIVTVIAEEAKARSLRGERARPRREIFSDARVLEVYFFAVLSVLPIRWACDRASWPPCLRKRPLPSEATVSRRLRSAGVRELLERVERRVVRPAGGEVGGPVHIVDSKPLPVGPHSHDRHARFGHAGGVKAKGYRLHTLLRGDGGVVDWRLTPMNVDERVMARRMTGPAELHGYVIGDGNFDDNKLHAVVDARGPSQGEALLVAPKHKGGFGRRPQRPGRLRSHALLTSPEPAFGTALCEARTVIERFFGRLTSSSWGLTSLPPWVRTFPRVLPYVRAKLTLLALADLRLTT